MPRFLKLSIDCPMCHVSKINKTIPSPGEATKIKQCTIINRNKMPLAQPIPRTTENNNKTKIEKCDISNLKQFLNAEEITNFKSLLSSRIKVRVPLKVDKSLRPPRSLIHADFVFYLVESIRGCESVLDIICLLSRCLFPFPTLGKETSFRCVLVFC